MVNHTLVSSFKNVFRTKYIVNILRTVIVFLVVAILATCGSCSGTSSKQKLGSGENKTDIDTERLIQQYADSLEKSVAENDPIKAASFENKLVDIGPPALPYLCDITRKTSGSNTVWLLMAINDMEVESNVLTDFYDEYLLYPNTEDLQHQGGQIVTQALVYFDRIGPESLNKKQRNRLFDRMINIIESDGWWLPRERAMLIVFEAKEEFYSDSSHADRYKRALQKAAKSQDEKVADSAKYWLEHM